MFGRFVALCVIMPIMFCKVNVCKWQKIVPDSDISYTIIIITFLSFLLQLLTLNPSPNSLQLVYKNVADTLSFTKYINVRSEEESNSQLLWYSLDTVYQENNDVCDR